jgi:hypothetical protein
MLVKVDISDKNADTSEAGDEDIPTPTAIGDDPQITEA